MSTIAVANRINASADAARTSIQTGAGAYRWLLMLSVTGTIQVTEVGIGQREVLWFANFDLNDQSATEDVKIGIECIYPAGIDGLGALARAA
ncbi:MAG: hypothetical protein FP825_10855 [Hyphomonas sp.]|uniref:hypothetical protein n=1 Tax=Hyphomonas sp. TaxID=87 RepID=UPI0017920C08|nr:hypothetical protein [Hyphomonas sp.]MBA3068969.1 hypothetical protein [Hyphomonas sp.]MBU3922072.1 hypothetical protein [Alphaproteobacteria bacterium]MBU4061602.1 hypothetical protein [Alphaproteobacteria bacterium]MBU4163447.1 hypothetical protein [Alphaproteobacteria bacterium]